MEGCINLDVGKIIQVYVKWPACYTACYTHECDLDSLCQCSAHLTAWLPALTTESGVRHCHVGDSILTGFQIEGQAMMHCGWLSQAWRVMDYIAFSYWLSTQYCAKDIIYITENIYFLRKRTQINRPHGLWEVWDDTYIHTDTQMNSNENYNIDTLQGRI